MELVELLFKPMFLSLVMAALTTVVVIKVYKGWGWVDDPKKKTHPKVVHTYPVPRGGGIPIFIAVAVGAMMVLGIDRHVMGILAGAMVLMIVGVVDDRWDLSPYWRLVWGVMAAVMVVMAGIGIEFISNPWGGIINLAPWQANAFAVVWMVWLMNIVNWSKGVDGQLPGVVAMAAIIIGLLSLKFSADVTEWPVTILAGLVAGAYLGFLPFNVYPQKIMPGYGGGALGGYFLAVLAILSTAKVGTALVVLGVPLVDAGYVIMRRIISGKSPVWGDRTHLHHRLLDVGWGKRRIALFYWGVTLMLGWVALNLNAQQKLYTILTLGLALGAFFLWLKRWSF